MDGLAIALTAFGIYVGFDMATTTYVGVYVGLTRSFAIALAVLIAVVWTGVWTMPQKPPSVGATTSSCSSSILPG